MIGTARCSGSRARGGRGTVIGRMSATALALNLWYSLRMRLRNRHRRAIGRVLFASAAAVALGGSFLLMLLGMESVLEGLHGWAAERG
jgi:hypothetical protein